MASYFSAKTIPVDFTIPICDSNKSYRLIQLANGLLVLLVSDPTSTMAAGALCVASGSHNDPDKIPGLAHLCEHALFLGTEEYPEPNAFREFIDASKGNCNAFTTGEQTCHYFELPANTTDKNGEPKFQKALEIFSSFFKTPLLREKSVRNEVNSVNNEHVGNINNLSKILFHALKILGNANHVFSRFSTGNYETLIDTPKLNNSHLHREIEEYFKSHYIAEKMSLVLKGPQSLIQLQKFAIKYFANIPTANTSRKHTIKRHSQSSNRASYATSTSSITLSNFHGSILKDSFLHKQRYNEIYPNQNLGKLLFIKDNNNSIVRLVFPIVAAKFDSDTEFYENVWCNILGDEADGSLCQQLYQNGLLNSLYVFSQRLTLEEKVLVMDLELTAVGAKKFSQILTTILKYITSIISKGWDSLPKYLSDMLTISKINYLYQQQNNSCMDEVSELSQRIQKDFTQISLKNAIKGYNDLDENNIAYPGDYSDDTTEFWKQTAQHFTSVSKEVLSLSNMNLIVLHNSELIIAPFAAQYSFNDCILSTDLHYNFSFKKYSLNLLKIYNSVLELDLHMTPPNLNQLVTISQIELNRLGANILSEKQKYLTKGLQTTPALLDFSNFHELWYKQEHSLSFQNRQSVSFQISSCDLPNTAMNIIGIELLCELIGTELRPKFYHSELTGFSWAIYSNILVTPSIYLEVTGLTHSFKKVLEHFIDSIKAYLQKISKGIKYKDLARARIKVRKQYTNVSSSDTIIQLLTGSTSFLEEGIVGLDDRIDAIEVIDQSHLQKIAQAILTRSKYLKIFIQGNLEDTEISQIPKILNSFTNHERIYLNHHISREPSSYGWKGDFLFSTININPVDPLDAVYYYIQFDNNTLMANLAAFFILGHATKELRIKKQLGYTVLTGVRKNRETTGIYILIQSGDYTGEELVEQIEKFLLELEQVLNKLTQQDLEDIINSFLESMNTEKDDGIPTNVLLNVAPCHSSTNHCCDSEVHRIHMGFWEEIVTGSYKFDKTAEIECLKNLNKEQFANFFETYISPKSKDRSTLSLLVQTMMTRSNIRLQTKKSILIQYLTHKNLCNKATANYISTYEGDTKLLGEDILKLLNQHYRLSFVESTFLKKAIQKITKMNPRKPDAQKGLSQIVIPSSEEFHKYCTPVTLTRPQIHREASRYQTTNEDAFDMLEYA